MTISFTPPAGSGASLTNPLNIGADVTDALWYSPRGATHPNGATNVVSPYSVWAVPASFSRDMEVTGFMLPYVNGTESAEGFPIDAVMIRFALYEANAQNTPGTRIGDWAWSAYTPGSSSPGGGFKQINIENQPATMLAGKQYFWVVMILGVTNNEDGNPESVFDGEVADFFRFWSMPATPLDPMASVGLSDEEVLYQPFGINSYFLGNIVDAICFTPGAALAPLPETLSPLWEGTYTASLAPVFHVKGRPL